ncbi:MAG: hypothetical protein NC820_07070 [Candidatus Omnitrophica bacterium]|nr:hypothetical protein [Candidatus Omnitrophota bacterium]
MSNKNILNILTREDILNTKDTQTEVIEVPEWGGSIKVQSLSFSKRYNILRGATDEETGKIDMERFFLLIFIECVIEPRFSQQDYGILREKSAVAMDRVINRILDLSGINKTVELKKNS